MVEAVAESGDMDFGAADAEKTFLRLSVALEERPTASVAFNVRTSVDGGETWTNQGTLSIGTDKRKSRIDFIASGSYLRYRLTSSSDVKTYTISEVTLQLIETGEESELD